MSEESTCEFCGKNKKIINKNSLMLNGFSCKTVNFCNTCFYTNILADILYEEKKHPKAIAAIRKNAQTLAKNKVSDNEGTTKF